MQTSLAWLARWRWHCLGIAVLVLELAFLGLLLMRPPLTPPDLPPPVEPMDRARAATVAPSPPADYLLPLSRPRPATPPHFAPTRAGRARPTPPILTPPVTTTPMPTLPTIAATLAATHPPPTLPVATPTLPAVVPFPTPPATPTPTPWLIPTATITPIPTATPPPTAIPQLTAGIVLRPELDTVAVGQQFQLQIRVQAGESNPVDTAQVYLVFAPARFAVVSLTAGPELEIPLQSQWDNARGRLDYAAGTLGEALTVPFILAMVTFRALSPTGPAGNYITFAALQSPRHTKAIAGGANITGNLTSAYLIVE